MLLFILGVLVLALGVALGVLLRRAARLRTGAATIEGRLGAVRERVERASAALARAAAARTGAPEAESLEAPDPVPAERPPRERRRTRRPPSPTVHP